MFTWRHFLWLAICFAAITAAVIIYRRRRPPLKIVLTIALIISIMSEVTKLSQVIELVPSANGELLLPYLPLNHMPLHFCSIQIILIACARFMADRKRREVLLAFMAPTCVIGGLMALGMPSIFSTTIPVEKAFVSPMSYQFFIFHSMLISLGLIIAQSGEIAWEWKHFRHTLLIVYAIGFVSIYLNSLLASPTYVDGELVSVDFWTNFFFTYENPLGIRLTELWQWYLYLVIIIGLSALTIFIFYLPLMHRKKK